MVKSKEEVGVETYGKVRWVIRLEEVGYGPTKEQRAVRVLQQEVTYTFDGGDLYSYWEDVPEEIDD